MQKETVERTANALAVPSQGKEKPGYFLARYWLRDLVLSVLLALIFIVFIYQPVQVEGTSMQPSLENHERIFVNKFVYRFEPVHRGDIVVFRYPLDPSKIFIKRIIGLPGDMVSLRQGRVYVNGKELAEPYLPPSYFSADSDPRIIVPPGQYYVLGDHREFSNDSRAWGTVEQKYIYGKAVVVYWPFSQLGSLN